MCLLIGSAMLISCDDSNDDSPKEASIEITEENVGPDAFAVTWEPVEDAVYYDVVISPDDNDQSRMVESGTSLDFDELLADTEYEISVTAGASFESEQITGKGSLTITTEALPEEFIGTWQYEYEELVATYVFNADGTGTYTYDNDQKDIRWKANDEEITITTYEESGTSQEESLEYSFNDNKDLLTIEGTHFFKQ
ncbi:MAG: fibronectin type III domain-containing protein [Marinilabilia sp.]